jgi:hypothetical protein
MIFMTGYMISGIRMTHVLGFGTVGKGARQASENERAPRCHVPRGKEGNAPIPIPITAESLSVGGAIDT